SMAVGRRAIGHRHRNVELRCNLTSDDDAVHTEPGRGKICVVPAAEYGAVRKNALRNLVKVARVVDGLEVAGCGTAEAVECRGLFSVHPVRADDLAIRPDALHV